MPRLFVAIDLPTAATAELARIQPQPGPGIRIVKLNQLHLTLHFIGETDIEVMAAALANVTRPTFSLSINGVGRFPPAGKASVLWAGIQESPELLALHAAVGAALSQVGYSPEIRVYTPHLTLARCAPKVPGDVIDDFLVENQGFSLHPFPVTGFALYSSILENDGPIYQRERWFSLSGAA